ncbi:MAG: hypothetical protein ACQEUT_08275 [Bacillota bacterium]
MKLISNKWFVLVVISVMALIITYFFFINKPSSQITKSISMAGMVIEEKHHYIEPGQYIEMWVIGYNGYEQEEHRERYKIFIEESMVYNLIAEGEQYMISASSFRKDEEFGYAYKLQQLSNQEEYQLTGKGCIK